jgi:hypothetical protein
MVGIYQYEGGLKFTGKIAETVEEAKAWLGSKYGKKVKIPSHFDKEKREFVYKEVFDPSYNENAFEILPVEKI